MVEVLAILEGGAKSFHSFKGGGGGVKVLPCLEARAQKDSDLQFSRFV